MLLYHIEACVDVTTRHFFHISKFYICFILFPKDKLCVFLYFLYCLFTFAEETCVGLLKPTYVGFLPTPPSPVQLCNQK